MPVNSLDLEALLSPDEDFSDPVKRAATAQALRKQFDMGTLGQLMGLAPTVQAGGAMQEQAGGSLKLALAKQQAAKEAQIAAQQRAETARWQQMNYDQRERSNDALAGNRATTQGVAQQAAGRADTAASDVHDLRATQIREKQQTDQDKYLGALGTAENALVNVDRLLNHPGRKAAVGGSFLTSMVPGTDARDYKIKLGQMSGTAFMQAREGLKGAGQVTDFEGRKAEQAVTVLMDQTATEAAHQQALLDFRDAMQRSVMKLRQRAVESGATPDLLRNTEPNPAPGPGQAASPGPGAATVYKYDAQGRRVQ